MTLRLSIHTPGGLLFDGPVNALRAEDSSGWFGVRPAARLEPLSLFAEVVRLVLATTPDLLLRLPLDRVAEVAREMTADCERTQAGLAIRVERTGVLPDADRDALRASLTRFVDARFPKESGDAA